MGLFSFGKDVKQKGFAPILIVILIVVVAGFSGFLIYSRQFKLTSPPQKPVVTSPTPQPTPAPSSSPNTNDKESNKLRVCPDRWFEFLSPIQVIDNPYFGKKGQFMLINDSIDLIPVEKFDLEWIKENCQVKKPEPVG